MTKGKIIIPKAKPVVHKQKHEIDELAIETDGTPTQILGSMPKPGHPHPFSIATFVAVSKELIEVKARLEYLEQVVANLDPEGEGEAAP